MFQVCGHLPVVMRKIASILQTISSEVPVLGSPTRHADEHHTTAAAVTAAPPSTAASAIAAAVSPPVAGSTATGFHVIVQRLQKCVLACVIARPIVYSVGRGWLCPAHCRRCACLCGVSGSCCMGVVFTCVCRGVRGGDWRR